AALARRAGVAICRSLVSQRRDGILHFAARRHAAWHGAARAYERHRSRVASADGGTFGSCAVGRIRYWNADELITVKEKDMIKQTGFVFAAVALAGCASMPDIELKYFPSRATTDVSVTQTIECTKDVLHISHVPNVTTTYSANRSLPTPLPSLRTGKL